MSVFLKDPSAEVDFSVDWSDWLGASESITGASWSVTPTGLSLGAESAAGAVRGVMTSGGALGSVYRLTNRIVTDQGRTEDRSVTIKVEER